MFRRTEDQFLEAMDAIVQPYLHKVLDSNEPIIIENNNRDDHLYRIGKHNIRLVPNFTSDRDDFHLDVWWAINYADFISDEQIYKGLIEYPFNCSLQGPTLNDLIKLNPDIVKQSVDCHDVYNIIIRDNPILQKFKKDPRILCTFSSTKRRDGEDIIILSCIASIINQKVNESFNSISYTLRTRTDHYENNILIQGSWRSEILKGGDIIRYENNQICEASSLCGFFKDKEFVRKIAEAVKTASIELNNYIVSGGFAKELLKRFKISNESDLVENDRPGRKP